MIVIKYGYDCRTSFRKVASKAGRNFADDYNEF